MVHDGTVFGNLHGGFSTPHEHSPTSSFLTPSSKHTNRFLWYQAAMRMETKKALVRANIIQCSLQCSAGVVILAGGKNKLAKLCPGISDWPWKDAYTQQAMNLHMYLLATWATWGGYPLRTESTSILNSCVFWVCILFQFTMYIQCIICQSSQSPFYAFHLPTKSTAGRWVTLAHLLTKSNIQGYREILPSLKWFVGSRLRGGVVGRCFHGIKGAQ